MDRVRKEAPAKFEYSLLDCLREVKDQVPDAALIIRQLEHDVEPFDFERESCYTNAHYLQDRVFIKFNKEDEDTKKFYFGETIEGKHEPFGRGVSIIYDKTSNNTKIFQGWFEPSLSGRGRSFLLNAKKILTYCSIG